MDKLGRLEVEQLKVTSTTPPADSGFYKIDETTMGVVGDLKFRHPKTGAMSSALTVTTTSDSGVALSGDGLDWMRVGYSAVFILGGQSNADGRGVLTSPEAPHPTAWLYDKNEVVRLLVEPSGKTGDGWINNVPAGLPADASAAASHSCATSFAKQLLQYGVNPLVVPCAIGSTDLTTHWLPPAVEDDRTTLFGAMTYRAKRAMRQCINPVFVWIGHEGNTTATDWTLTAGTPGSAYALKWAEHVRQLRKRFPSCIVLYVQLGAYYTAAAALTRHVVACDQQRRLEDGFSDSTFVSGTFVDAKPIGAADVYSIVATDANNTVTVNADGSFRIVSDGTKAPGFYSLPVKKGLTYRLTANIRAGLTGGIRVSADDQKTAWMTAGVKTLTFIPSADTRLQFYRNTACDVTFDSLVLEEDLYNYAKVGCHMFVAHDIPRNAAPDDVHYSAAGQKSLGRRIAKLYAERVLGVSAVGEAGNTTTLINGSGPRLMSVTQPSSTTVKVKFNKTIQASATGYGAALATSLFRVYDGGTEKTLASCERDPADDTAVLITLSSAAAGVVVVTYGDRIPPTGAEQWRPGAVYDTDGLPAPAFMQLAA